jgi:hypothetical protein
MNKKFYLFFTLTIVIIIIGIALFIQTNPNHKDKTEPLPIGTNVTYTIIKDNQILKSRNSFDQFFIKSGKYNAKIVSYNSSYYSIKIDITPSFYIITSADKKELTKQEN